MRSLLVLTGLSLFAIAVDARASVSSDVRKTLAPVPSAWEKLDLDRALFLVDKAKSLAKTPDDEALCDAYEGVVLRTMGRLDEGEAALRKALDLRPTLRIPFRVPAKFQAAFDAGLAVARAPPPAPAAGPGALPPPPPAVVNTSQTSAPGPAPSTAAPPAATGTIFTTGPGGKPKLVVLQLSPAGEVPPEVAGALTETVTAEVAGRGFFAVIGAKEVETLLGVERQRELLGGSSACKDQGGCLSQIGNALGARFVMSGTVAKLGTAYQLNLQVLDSEKGQTFGRSTRLAKDLVTARAQIPYAVAEACQTPLPPPPSRIVPYSLIAGGIAVLAGGALAGYDGLSRERVADTEFGASSANPTVLKTYSSYQSESSTISLEKSLSLVGLIAGAGLIVGGIYLNPPEVVSGAGVHLTLVPSPSGVALVGVMP
jgi:TolB-like protein